MVKERNVVEAVEKELKQYVKTGQLRYHKNHGNMYQTVGRPDFVILLQGGRHIEIEAKAGNGHQIGDAQLFNGYQVTRLGGYFVLAFPDYQSLKQLPTRQFPFDFKAQKVNELNDEEYNLLKATVDELTKAKQSVMFVPKY